MPKQNGNVRIWVDYTKLNQIICRELHMLSTVDGSLAKLANAKAFSKLDANSGFWQVPLIEDLRLLTIFIMPIGRFCFNRLLFGMFSAEHFQRKRSTILDSMLDNAKEICFPDILTKTYLKAYFFYNF